MVRPTSGNGRKLFAPVSDAGSVGGPRARARRHGGVDRGYDAHGMHHALLRRGETTDKVSRRRCIASQFNRRMEHGETHRIADCVRVKEKQQQHETIHKSQLTKKVKNTAAQ
ncbi:hypothetical protein Bbelb_420860 [Branchiostoma belcheri]|nr:hypothetical protein Bbelb_439980 [Branchiostoma belcheri]KAI8480167.1 hypothetical protein Bbelb_420860 [Branchiostoma belcheri]